MKTITRIGMDTAKNVFQLHGVDESEAVVLRRQFRRREMIAFFEKLPPVLVAIEACGSSHHWARMYEYCPQLASRDVAARSCPAGWCRKVFLRGWPPSIFW